MFFHNECSFSVRLLPLLQFSGAVLIDTDCMFIADTEKLPVPAEQEQEIQVTSPAFQDQLDILETKGIGNEIT